MTSVKWSDDEGLFSLARRELFTAVVGDIMDKLGISASVFAAAHRSAASRYGGHRAGDDGAGSRCL